MKKFWTNVLLFVSFLVVVLILSPILITWPIPSAVATALFVAALWGRQTVTFFGKAIKVAWLALILLAAFMVMEVILGYIFSVSIGDLYDRVGERGPLYLLLEPRHLAPEIMKQLACLALAALIASGYVFSVKRTRWHVTAAGVCLSYLLLQTFALSSPNEYALLRNAVGRYSGSLLARVGLALDKTQNEATVKAEEPKFKYVVSENEVPMYDSALVDTGEVFKPGQRVQVRHDLVIPHQTGINYVYAITQDEPPKAGFIRVSMLEEKLPKGFFTPTVKKYRGAVPVIPAVYTVRRPLEDIVEVSTLNWTTTAIVPLLGERYTIRGFSSQGDVERVVFRQGAGPIAPLFPNEKDGEWYAIAAWVKGSNLGQEKMLVKATSGEKLTLRIERRGR